MMWLCVCVYVYEYVLGMYVVCRDMRDHIRVCVIHIVCMLIYYGFTSIYMRMYDTCIMYAWVCMMIVMACMGMHMYVDVCVDMYVCVLMCGLMCVT